jgi:nucleoside-diphosphate-sugar epimerase
MNVVVFGSTGLVGHGVLLEALDHPSVERVVTVGRRASEIEHDKVDHVVCSDFTDLSPIADRLEDLDACFWCLGVSSAGMSEEDYSRVTYDYTVAAAEVLKEKNPDLCFCFVSGAGTDDTEKGRTMWARVKGRAENYVKRTFDESYLFRPAFIRPMRGARSKTALYRVLNPLLLALNPLLRVMNGATSTVEIGKAMIAAASGLADTQVLDSKAINALAAKLDAQG